MKNKNKKQIIVFLIAIITIIIDQVSKFLAINLLDIAKEKVIIKNFFSLFCVKNTGAAFSNFTGQIPFLIVVSIFCIILIINIIFKEKYKYKLSYLSLGILLGGMIGNLIDRIFFNGVIDFLSFKIINYRFPVFNIADIGITCGVAIYIILSLLEEKLEKKKNLWYN